MLQRIIRLIKHTNFWGLLFWAFRMFLYKVFRMRLVNGGLLSVASVATEQRVFSKCALQYSDQGYYFLNPMPSVEELDEYYSTYYWDPKRKPGKTTAQIQEILHYNLLSHYVPEALAADKVSKISELDMVGCLICVGSPGWK